MILEFNPGEVILSGSLLAALPVAALAGLISFLSPCVLPLVPGYLGFVSGSASTSPTNSKQRLGNRSRILLGSLAFVLGFTVVFVAFGAIIGSLGGALVAQQLDWLQRILGVVIVVMGLVMIGKIEWLQRTVKFQARPGLGLFGALLLGFAFGLGWTPCIGPTLAAVLTLASQTGSALQGGILSVAYALGLGIPFLLIGAGLGWATKSVTWVKKHIRAINVFGGSLLIALGLSMALGIWQLFTAWLQNEVIAYFPIAF